jgi:hypothetical protein
MRWRRGRGDGRIRVLGKEVVRIEKVKKNMFLFITFKKILSSQKRGGYRGVSIDSFRLRTPSLMFFFNT